MNPLSMTLIVWLVSPARADIADSGDLIIGDHATVVGSMTVQGNAFSVGNTTFSVAGGSVTLGGRLNLGAAGIKWPDGTITTTPPSANGAVLSATQTFSGANTFTNGVKVTAAAPATPDTNTLYGETFPKAWIQWDMSTDVIAADFGVSSITDDSFGRDTINFANAFPSANYAVAGSCHRSNETRQGMGHGSMTTTSILVGCDDTGGSMVESTKATLIILGAQ